ncbi:protein phosphatase CheZ [Galenea microaerophila]
MLSENIELETVEALKQAIIEQNFQKGDELLHQLFAQSEREIVEGMEDLANQIQNTLISFAEETDLLTQAKHDLPDATERLNYVIEETEKASHSTLEAAEKIYETLEQALNEAEQESVKNQIQEAMSLINTIILAQGFQDLTGQVLKKVIHLVTELERNLKTLIEKSGIDYDFISNKTEAEKQAEREKGMGPNVTQKSKQDAVSDQGDVDDLLANLGI